MWQHDALSDQALFSFIRAGKISIGGNRPAKIFGLLSCSSGKRMKRSNRVFFENINAAVAEGYRPCAHCMKLQYQLWKLKKLKQ
jgi:methylphosphotriester-DNA--protein-cysteine methyltransferase